MKKAITVNYYNFMKMTKKQYIIAQALAFGLVLPFLIVALWYLHFLRADPLLITLLTVLLPVVIVAEIIETVVMLRLFHKKEKLARTHKD